MVDSAAVCHSATHADPDVIADHTQWSPASMCTGRNAMKPIDDVECHAGTGYSTKVPSQTTTSSTSTTVSTHDYQPASGLACSSTSSANSDTKVSCPLPQPPDPHQQPVFTKVPGTMSASTASSLHPTK
eukprot:533379-Amphidinium_carterae.1